MKYECVLPCILSECTSSYHLDIDISIWYKQKGQKVELIAVSDTIEVHCLWSETKMTLTMIERLNFESVIMHFRRK